MQFIRAVITSAQKKLQELIGQKQGDEELVAQEPLEAEELEDDEQAYDELGNKVPSPHDPEEGPEPITPKNLEINYIQSLTMTLWSIGKLRIKNVPLVDICLEFVDTNVKLFETRQICMVIN